MKMARIQKRKIFMKSTQGMAQKSTLPKLLRIAGFKSIWGSTLEMKCQECLTTSMRSIRKTSIRNYERSTKELGTEFANHSIPALYSSPPQINFLGTATKEINQSSSLKTSSELTNSLINQLITTFNLSFIIT
jgi:hypothetical protein